MSTPPATPFVQLDTQFQTLYREFTLAAAANVTVMVLNPPVLTLAVPSQPPQVVTLTAPVDSNLKAIAHMGPALYALGQPGPAAGSAALLSEAVEAALQAVPTSDWSSPAWPGQSDVVQTFAANGLEQIQSFLAANPDGWSPHEYEAAMGKFAPFMAGCFLLALVSNAYSITVCLRSWKSQLGADWDETWTMVIGSTGAGSVRGVSRSDNNMTEILKLTLSDEQMKDRLLFAPTAQTVDQAKIALGAAVTTKGMGKGAFPDAAARKLLGIYDAIESQVEDLAMGPTRAAAHNIEKGGGPLHVPGLGPLTIAPVA